MAASATGNPLPLAGAVAILSGGLGDIGRATAGVLRAAGAQVALSDLAPLATGRRAMPGYHYSRLDVTQPAAIERWVARVSRELGPPSLAICNAAIVEAGSAVAATPESWERTLAVNLTGSFFLAQSAARAMLRNKRAGRIVFVGSWAGGTAHAKITAYSVAKAGLRMAMECLAIELAPHGIAVNEIAPGIVDAGLSGRDMARRPGLRRKIRQKIPLRRLLSAEDVARGILFICLPENRHMTGAVLRLDGGLTLQGPL